MVASRHSEVLVPEPAFRRHIFGLDLIRLLAALGVGVFHLTWRYQPLAGYPPVGWVGVQIFFVLSGFVIAASARGVSPTIFAYRRFMRLYPAAWICTFASLAFIVQSDSIGSVIGANYKLNSQDIASSLTLYGNGFLVSSSWTLQIELAFYAIVAIALMFRRAPDLSVIAKALIAWNAIYITAYVAWQLSLIDAPWLDLDYGKRNMSLLRHGSYFALGIFMTVPGTVARRLWPWVCLGVTCATLEMLFRGAEIAGKASGDASGAEIGVLAIGIWSFFCLAMVASIRLNHHVSLGPKLGRWIRAGGLASYPFYLLHESVGGTIMGELVALGITPELGLWIGLATTAVASYLVAEFGEPALRRLVRAALALFSVPMPSSPLPQMAQKEES